MPYAPDDRYHETTPRGVELLTALAGEIEIRGLNRQDAPLLAAHLKRLPPEARQSRFHAGINDQAIEDYVGRIDWHTTYVFGAMIDDMPCAVAELVPDTGRGEAEIAVSVEPGYQHLGLGRLLILAAMLAARHLGLKQLVLTYQNSNRGMRALLQEMGGTPIADGHQITAVLPVPAAGIIAADDHSLSE